MFGMAALAALVLAVSLATVPTASVSELTPVTQPAVVTAPAAP